MRSDVDDTVCARCRKSDSNRATSRANGCHLLNRDSDLCFLVAHTREIFESTKGLGPGFPRSSTGSLPLSHSSTMLSVSLTTFRGFEKNTFID